MGHPEAGREFSSFWVGCSKSRPSPYPSPRRDEAARGEGTDSALRAGFIPSPPAGGEG